jgi:hypothetical protein
MKALKKNIVCLIIILLSGTCMQAQLKFKNYLLAGSSMFVSGLVDGTLESINYHYEDGFKLRCPKANDKFWNPAVSWKNKYRNNDPAQGPKFAGSTNIFVFTTDAYHLLRATNRTLDGVTLAYYVRETCEVPASKKKKWLFIARDFIILSAIRSVGFHLTYSLMFKKQ